MKLSCFSAGMLSSQTTQEAIRKPEKFRSLVEENHDQIVCNAYLIPTNNSGDHSVRCCGEALEIALNNLKDTLCSL